MRTFQLVRVRSYFEKLFEADRTRILAALVVAAITVRFLFFWLLETLDPSYLASLGSLIDNYLIPRISVTPWTVDWSYGPLTYDLYWLLARLPSNQIITRTINIIADAGTTYCMAILSRRLMSPSRSILTAAAWAFFPLSIVNSIAGQIDALPVLATVAAIYCAVDRKPWPSFILIALGFNLKLFPILILPIIAWTFRRRMHLIHLFTGSMLPFIFYVFSLPLTASLSGLTPASIIVMMIQRFQRRTPSGTSVLNLLEAQLPQAQSLLLLVSAATYLALLLLLVSITVRSSDNSSSRLVTGSALIIFASVNLSVMVQSNYLLWCYPIMIAAIMIETENRYLALQLVLFSLAIVLNNLFAFARITQLTRDTLPANSGLLDLLTIGGYQLAAWVLFIVVWRRMHSAIRSELEDRLDANGVR